MPNIQGAELTALARSAALGAEVDEKQAVEFVKSLIAAAAVSQDLRFEVPVELQVTEPGDIRASGLPCIVSIRHPFGCICLVPPGGDC